MLDTRGFPNSVFHLHYSHQGLCKPDDFHFPYLVIKTYDLLYKKYDYDSSFFWKRRIFRFYKSNRPKI